VQNNYCGRIFPGSIITPQIRGIITGIAPCLCLSSEISTI
jgi:hypothetical protein